MLTAVTYCRDVLNCRNTSRKAYRQRTFIVLGQETTSLHSDHFAELGIHSNDHSTRTDAASTQPVSSAQAGDSGEPGGPTALHVHEAGLQNGENEVTTAHANPLTRCVCADQDTQK